MNKTIRHWIGKAIQENTRIHSVDLTIESRIVWVQGGRGAAAIVKKENVWLNYTNVLSIEPKQNVITGKHMIVTVTFDVSKMLERFGASALVDRIKNPKEAPK